MKPKEDGLYDTDTKMSTKTQHTLEMYKFLKLFKILNLS